MDEVDHLVTNINQKLNADNTPGFDSRTNFQALNSLVARLNEGLAKPEDVSLMGDALHFVDSTVRLSRKLDPNRTELHMEPFPVRLDVQQVIPSGFRGASPIQMQKQKAILPAKEDSQKKESRTTGWRKYGQKRMKGKEFEGLDVLRCYYKCTTPGCTARKQVEKHAWDDAETSASVVMLGNHNHPVKPDAAEEVPTMPLRIVPARSPNTPRIDHSFISRLDKQPIFWFLVSTNEHGHLIQHSSDNITEATGYSSAELLHRSCFFLFGEETKPFVKKAMCDAMERGDDIQKQMVLNYKKCGETFWNNLAMRKVTPGTYMCMQCSVSIEKPKSLPAAKRARMQGASQASTSKSDAEASNSKSDEDQDSASMSRTPSCSNLKCTNLQENLKEKNDLVYVDPPAQGQTASNQLRTPSPIDLVVENLEEKTDLEIPDVDVDVDVEVYIEAQA